MKLGICSDYLVKLGTREGSKLIHSHGFSYLDYSEFSNTEADFFKLPEKEFEKYLLEQRKIMESEGIFISQTHGPWRYPPRDLEPGDRAERFASMSKAIRGTAYLGAKNFVIHPLMPFGAYSSENPEKMWEINLEFMARLAHVGEENGITVCYENMPFYSSPITTPHHVLEMAKQIGSKYFKICLDTGHALICGVSPADAVREIGKEYLACLHVHDNNGKNDLHDIPLTGVLDWKDFMASLNEIGYDGVFSLENGLPPIDENKMHEELEKNLFDIEDSIKRLSNL